MATPFNYRELLSQQLEAQRERITRRRESDLRQVAILLDRLTRMQRDMEAGRDRDYADEIDFLRAVADVWSLDGAADMADDIAHDNRTPTTADLIAERNDYGYKCARDMA